MLYNYPQLSIIPSQASETQVRKTGKESKYYLDKIYNQDLKDHMLK